MRSWIHAVITNAQTNTTKITYKNIFYF
jgi:hypothetical protein